jgi:hypothetical protein
VTERFISTAAKPDAYQGEILDILMEECAEVIQRVTKMKRFGIDEVQTGMSYDNAYRLGLEVGDLFHMVDLAIAAGLIPIQAIEHGQRAKAAQLEKFLQNRRAT